MKSIVEMVKDKECKGSIRYKNVDPKAAITNVYVFRHSLPDPAPDTNEVTIESR